MLTAEPSRSNVRSPSNGGLTWRVRHDIMIAIVTRIGSSFRFPATSMAVESWTSETATTGITKSTAANFSAMRCWKPRCG